MDIQANEEREGMQAMQRRQGCVGDTERGRACGGCRGWKDVVLTMVLIEDMLILLLMALICPPMMCWPSSATAAAIPPKLLKYQTYIITVSFRLLPIVIH